MKIVWSAQSRRDLKAIQSCIAKDSEHYARLQVLRIVRRIESVAEMPSRGHRVHEFTELPLREAHEGIYRIIYSDDETDLKVITILHMKQRLDSEKLR